MKLETEKTYIAHIKSLKGERWVEAERRRGKRERQREREKKRKGEYGGCIIGIV